MSLFESVVNMVVGYGVSFSANLIVLPWFGYFPTMGQAAFIGAVMTVVSIIRSYFLRRFFEWWRVVGYHVHWRFVW